MEDQLPLTKNDEKLGGSIKTSTKKFKLPLKIIHDDQRLTINLIENQIDDTENGDKKTLSNDVIKQVNIYPNNKSTFTNVSTKIENDETKKQCKKTRNTSNLFNFFRKNSDSIAYDHQNGSNRYSNIVNIIKETFHKKNSELGDVFVMPLLKLSDYRSDYVDTKLSLVSSCKINTNSKIINKNEEPKQVRTQVPNPPLRSDSISASFSNKDNFNEIIRLVKKRNSSVSVSGSGVSGQTNKLDALKNEIDKTMNEISKFKRKVKIQKVSKCMVDMGVNTDITMFNPQFKVNYDEISTCSNDEEDICSFSSNYNKNSYLTCFKPNIKRVHDITYNKSNSISESFASGFNKIHSKRSNTNNRARVFKPIKGSLNINPSTSSSNKINFDKGYYNKKEPTLYNIYCNKSSYPIDIDDQEDDSILVDERSNTVFKKIFQRQPNDPFKTFEDESELTHDKHLYADSNSDDTTKSFSLTDLSEIYEPLKRQKLFDFGKVNTFKPIIEPPVSNDEESYTTQLRLGNSNIKKNKVKNNNNFMEQAFVVPKKTNSLGKKGSEDVKLKIIPLNPNLSMKNHHSILMMMMKNSTIKKDPITSFSFISNDTYFAKEPKQANPVKLECTQKRVHHMPRANSKATNQARNVPCYYSKSASFNLHRPIKKSSLPALNYLKHDNWSMNSLNETRRMRSEDSSNSNNFRDIMSRYEIRLSKIESDESANDKNNQQASLASSKKPNKFKSPNLIKTPDVLKIDSKTERKQKSKSSQRNSKYSEFKSVNFRIFLILSLLCRISNYNFRLSCQSEQAKT
jgi:hypothetical protein